MTARASVIPDYGQILGHGGPELIAQTAQTAGLWLKGREYIHAVAQADGFGFKGRRSRKASTGVTLSRSKRDVAVLAWR